MQDINKVVLTWIEVIRFTMHSMESDMEIDYLYDIMLGEELDIDESELKLDPEYIFMNGNCGNLFTILSKKFATESPTAHIVYYEGEPMHIVTKIGNKFYDINGEFDITKYCEYLNVRNSDMQFGIENFSISQEVGDVEVERQSNKCLKCSENEMHKLERELKSKKALALATELLER